MKSHTLSLVNDPLRATSQHIVNVRRAIDAGELELDSYDRAAILEAMQDVIGAAMGLRSILGPHAGAVSPELLADEGARDTAETSA